MDANWFIKTGGRLDVASDRPDSWAKNECMSPGAGDRGQLLLSSSRAPTCRRCDRAQQRASQQVNEQMTDIGMHQRGREATK